MKKKMIITGALLAGTIGAAVCLTGCGTTTINLNDYVKVDYEGYDGYGTATVSLDIDAIEEKYGNKINLTDNAKWLEYDSIAEVISDSAEVSISQTEGLSNGDNLTITWDVWTEYIEECADDDLQVTYEKTSCKVEGLEKIPEVDIFEYVDVVFSGAAPKVTAELEVSGGLSESYFTLSEKTGTLSVNSGLDIGSVVTVTVSEYYMDEIIETLGAKPDALSKDYEVSGVSYYITSLDEVSDEAMEVMESKAEAAISEMVQYWNDPDMLTSCEHIGDCLMYIKNTTSSYSVNRIALIYEYHSNQNGEDVTVYWFCMFYGGEMSDDGVFSIDYDNYLTPSDIFGKTVQHRDSSWGLYTYRGFDSLDSLYEYLAGDTSEIYTIESSVEA